MPIFIVFFEKQPKICQKKAPPKNDNFSHFAKHRFIKKNRYVATPLLTKNWCFWTWVFWNQKQWCWTTNITQNQEKIKIRERDFKEKTRQETKKREHIHWKPRNCNFIFHVVLFMKQKQRRKNNEKRDKNKKEKESQRRKTRRKKERQEEKRDRERETEKGEAKKGEGRKKEKHWK